MNNRNAASAIADEIEKLDWKNCTIDHLVALGKAVDALRAIQASTGEPIQVETVAITREDDDGLYLDWVLEGGISALEAPGVVLLVAHGTVTNAQGSGEVYLAPPAAAHGDEAVQYRLLRVGEVIQATDELLRDDCTTWQPMSDGPQIGIGWDWHAGLVPVRRIDAAMRAQGDG